MITNFQNLELGRLYKIKIISKNQWSSYYDKIKNNREIVFYIYNDQNKTIKFFL